MTTIKTVSAEDAMKALDLIDITKDWERIWSVEGTTTSIPLPTKPVVVRTRRKRVDTQIKEELARLNISNERLLLILRSISTEDTVEALST